MTESQASVERRGGPLGRVGWHVLIVTVGLVYAVPLVWMGAVSLKPADQAAGGGLGVLPRFDGESGPLRVFDAAYWRALAGQAARNYADVWHSPIADFPLYLKNSAVVGLLSVVGMVASSAIAAYGFSRLRWRGRDALFLVVLSTLMVPPVVLMAPLYVLFRQLGWIGGFLPLWVPCWFGGAFSIFLLRQFFLTIPRELDEAARIDGCSHWGVFWRVILPNAKPALIVVALMQFIATWNDFLGPLLFLNKQEKYTLSLGLQMYQSQHGGTPWNLVMAASVLVVLPVLGLYLLARRMFVEGVAATGLKE